MDLDTHRARILGVSTWLDVAAVGAVAGGVGYGLWPYLAGFAVACAGVVVALGSGAIVARAEPAPPTAERNERAANRARAKQLRKAQRAATWLKRRHVASSWTRRLRREPAGA